MRSFILRLLLCLIIPYSSLAEEIIIAISERNHHLFINFSKGTPCEEIDSFNTPHATRSSIEPTLICKALHIAGVYPKIIFKKTPNYIRALKHTKSGLTTIHSETVWKSDAGEDHLLITDPIIRYGEFEKVFYARKDVRDEIEKTLKQGQLKGISSLEILKKYNVVSSENWTIDWQTLQELGFHLSSAPRYELMYKMVYYNRVHLLLGEPSTTEDMTIFDYGIRLYPVRGIKVGLKESRHFVVSKKHPDSLRIYNALQRGVKTMRNDGTIERAFHESGFFHPLLKEWEKL